MTPPDDLIRLRHLRDAAEKAIAYTQDRSRQDLEDDELLRLAVTKLVEIVGEAAKQVTPATRLAHPEVEWSAAVRMRDRLVHHYFDIDLDVLWANHPARPAGASRRAPHDRGLTAARDATCSPCGGPTIGVGDTGLEPVTSAV